MLRGEKMGQFLVGFSLATRRDLAEISNQNLSQNLMCILVAEHT
jgi:hypothetical protein